MKIQKSVLLVKKKIKINGWKIKKYCKVGDHCYDAGEYRVAANSICNLLCSVPKKVPIVLQNGLKLWL